MKTNIIAQIGVGAALAFAISFAMAFPAIPARGGIPEPDLVWYGRVEATAGGVSVRLSSGTLVWRIEPVAGGAPWILSTQLTNLNDQFSFVLRVPCESLEPGVAAGTNLVVLTAPARTYRRATVTLDGEALTFTGGAPIEFSPGIRDRGRAERVDLRLGSAPVDSDNNGLADAWELEHYRHIGVDPNADTDGDGMTSLQEYRAGTVPTNAQSRFAFIEIQPVFGGVQVRWSSQQDRRYRVLRSSSLAGPGSFQAIRTGLVATPPANEFLDPAAPGAGAQFFYRIELED